MWSEMDSLAVYLLSITVHQVFKDKYNLKIGFWASKALFHPTFDRFTLGTLRLQSGPPINQTLIKRERKWKQQMDFPAW